MKFFFEEINEVFEWDGKSIPTIVIENQGLFRKMLQEINFAIEGRASGAVLSEDNITISMARQAELLSNFIRFEINQKPLINKIVSELERVAMDATHYVETQEVLATVENAIDTWAFEFPCGIIAPKVSVSSLIKAAGIELQDDYFGEKGEVERILDYIELVREFDCEKVFFTANMRSFFPDEAIELFMETAVAHEYKILMIESKAYDPISLEKRLTIDKDLCEI